MRYLNYILGQELSVLGIIVVIDESSSVSLLLPSAPVLVRPLKETTLAYFCAPIFLVETLLFEQVLFLKRFSCTTPDALHSY